MKRKIICSYDSKFHLPVHKPLSELPVDLVNHPPPGGSMLLRQLANVSRVWILIYISSMPCKMSIVGILLVWCMYGDNKKEWCHFLCGTLFWQAQSSYMVTTHLTSESFFDLDILL